MSFVFLCVIFTIKYIATFMAPNAFSCRVQRHLQERNLIRASLFCLLLLSQAMVVAATVPNPPRQPFAQQILDTLVAFRDKIQPDCRYLPIYGKKQRDLEDKPNYQLVYGENELPVLMLTFFEQCAPDFSAQPYPTKMDAVLNVLRKSHLIRHGLNPLAGGKDEGDFRRTKWNMLAGRFWKDDVRKFTGILLKAFAPDCDALNRYRQQLEARPLDVSTDPAVLGQAYELLGKYALGNFIARMGSFFGALQDERIIFTSEGIHADANYCLFLGALFLTEDVQAGRFHDFAQQSPLLLHYTNQLSPIILVYYSNCLRKSPPDSLDRAQRLAHDENKGALKPLVLPLCAFYFFSFTRGIDPQYQALITSVRDPSSASDELRISYTRLVRAIQMDYLEFKSSSRQLDESDPKVVYQATFVRVKRRFLTYLAREFFCEVLIPKLEAELMAEYRASSIQPQPADDSRIIDPKTDSITEESFLSKLVHRFVLPGLGISLLIYIGWLVFGGNVTSPVSFSPTHHHRIIIRPPPESFPREILFIIVAVLVLMIVSGSVGFIVWRRRRRH